MPRQGMKQEPKMTLSARVIRANGEIEDLGVVCGGSLWNRIVNKIRRLRGRY